MIDPNANYIRRIELNDILELKKVARGVSMEITQLDAGTFESDVAQLKVRNVLASLITPNRRLRLHGKLNYLTFSFLGSVDGQSKWHGRGIHEYDVVAANPGADFDLVTAPGTEAICISTMGNADVILRNLGGPVFATKIAATSQPIPCHPATLQKFRAWLAARFTELGPQAEIPETQAREIETEFLRRLAACVRAGKSSGDGRQPSARRFSAVQRVEEHLLHDLAFPQTVADLCSVAGTSRRTLEYAFRDYFGTSPKKFIKALRLNAARNDLLRGHTDSSQVVEIASGWGFSHMGQFAADYRHLFGETPSDTLRRL
jgi:AraC family ethanolamine operon transcriptional activator